MIPEITNASALKLHRLARRKLMRKLDLYGMTMQQADIDDLSTDALIKALETIAKRPPKKASEITGAVHLSVGAVLINWIEQQTCHSSHLSPFADDPVDSSLVADSEPSSERLPSYVSRLCRDVDELRAAIVLSGMTFDGRTFLEMSNEMAAAELNCSVRKVQRYKATLRQRFSLFAPDKLRDMQSLVTPD
jgi:DNA-directed RNA polymerase specialized sigma24 family protein